MLFIIMDFGTMNTYFWILAAKIQRHGQNQANILDKSTKVQSNYYVVLHYTGKSTWDIHHLGTESVPEKYKSTIIG